ncbi:MAG TPA: flagellar motor switch protein FliN [Acidothermaceae bacterium]|nr:flagellar motor switch protein FliN [Acidothermaceae bacterium]
MTESTAAEVLEPEGSFTAMTDGSSAVAAVADDTARGGGRKRAKTDDPTANTLQAFGGAERLDLLSNVEMDVTAELGRTRMTVRELLSLTPGVVVELDRMAGSPIDLFVNGTLIARGEVVVIDEEFGVRITEIVTPGAAESGR